MNETVLRYLKAFCAFGLCGFLVVLSPLASASSPIVEAGKTFECTPTHVYDGDGPIWCEEGPRLRLAGIAARELDGTCKLHHPCPDATAEDARDALVSLVGVPTGVGQHNHILVTGPTMQCLSDGPDRHNRTVAWCVSPQGGDINCEMIGGGWASLWDIYWNEHSCP